MTEALKKLLDGQSRGKVLRSIRQGVINWAGPKTVPQMWDELTTDPLLHMIRDELPTRGSAGEIGNAAISVIARLPNIDTTDHFLRLIQQNTATEIYPGSYRDLNLRDPKTSESNPDR